MIDSASPLVTQWETLIHETLHAAAPYLAEEEVEKLEMAISATVRACHMWFTPLLAPQAEDE